MDFEMLHPEHGHIDTSRAFGTISFASLEPDYTFSCQFRDYIADSIKELNGPVAVVDRDLLEVVVIIDSIKFEFDEDGDIDLSISVAEVSEQVKTNVLYTMFLFSGYDYEVNVVPNDFTIDKQDDITASVSQDFFSILPKPIGKVTLIDNSDIVDEESEIRAFPRVEVEARINLINCVAIALSEDSEKVMFIDFNSRAHLEAMQKHKNALGQDMSDQIALMVFAMIMAHVDGEAETNVEYNIYQAVCVN